MKSYLLLVVFILLSLIGFSQTKKDLEAKVTTLTSENQKLMNDLLDLKQQIIDLKTENANCKTQNEQLRLANSTNISTSPNTSNSVISNPNIGTSKTTSDRCLAITNAGTQCTRTAQAGSKYCWQHQNYAGPDATSGQNSKISTGTTRSSTTTTKSFGNTSSGRIIQTGPRGGQYYINKNGNKTYIKKK